MINFNKSCTPFYKPNTGSLFSKNFGSLKVLILLAMVLVLGVNEVMGQNYQTFDASTTNALTASKWTAASATNACNAGTKASAFTTGNIAYFCTASGTGSGATGITVGGIIATESYTHSLPSGTFATGGTVATINIASGKQFDLSTATISTAAGTGFNKTGSGAFAISGSAYTGGFTLTNGAIILRGSNTMGNGALTLNGGTVCANASRDLTGKFTSITIGGDVQFGEVTGTFPLAATASNLTFSNNMSLGSLLRTLTLGGSGIMTFGGVISNTASTGITFVANANGTGRFDVTGTNTFSGPVNINGNGTSIAEVRFTTDASIGNTGNTININGGRLATVNSGAFSITSGRGIQVGNTAGTSISTPGTGVLTFNGVIADLAGATPGAWAKQGGGTLSLGGVSTYTGSTSINNGTLQLTTGNDRLPTGTVLSLGQAASANLGTFDLNGRNQTIGGLNSTTGTNATASNNTITSGSSATLTVSGSGTYGDATNTNSGIISGAISLVKSGSGTLTLGDANTYTGTTTISGGTLAIANTTVIPDASNITLDGGIFSTGASAGFTETVGTLNLNSNSTIALGTGAHTLTFAASNGVTWNGTTLTVTGWTGTAGALGTAGKIVVGSGGLTAGQLAKINFSGYSNGAVIVSGEVVPVGTTAPIIGTPTATSITDVSAILGATITDDGGSSITARGTSYKTSSPVVAADNQLAEGGTTVAAYSHSRTILTPQTQYFYAGYATNSIGTSLSSESNFRTLSAAPTAQSSGVTTTAVSASQIDLTITAATFPAAANATQGGYVLIYSTGTPSLSSANGAAPAAGVGTIFTTSATNLPTTPSTTVNVTGLSTATTYNFLVVPYTWDGTNVATYNYLTSSAPTANTTTNSGPPTLTIPTVASITNNSATLGATVTNDGGSALVARGTVYKTSATVAITDNPLAEGGTSVAAFTHSRTSLNPETQYFYAGYATNASTSGLSSESSFRTLSNPPTVQAGLSATAASTTQIDLTISAATFPGSGATQAGYVVIYSTGTPTLSSANGSAPAAGVGSIFSNSATVLPSTPSTTVSVTGLSLATNYNFLVVPYTWDGTNASTYNYLTTSAPTANATTNASSPTLTTPTATSISNNSATLGATVTANGGAALTARGTIYKTSASVTISDNPLAEGGTSVAAFTHSRSSLSPETQYFYRGYATNSSANGLSSESSFRTLSNPPTVQAGLIATAASTTQINLTITTATFPVSGATQAGYVVIYATGTPTFTATNGQAPASGVGTIFATSTTVLPATPSTSVSVTGLTQSTLYNFLVIPYTWDGTNTATYNYLTNSAPTANATTQGPVNIAIQDFETVPATPTLSYSNTNGATITGSSASGDRPASTNFYTSSNTAWNANNTSSLVTLANVTGLDLYISKVFEFRLASFSIGSTGNGADGGDIVTVEVSLDGGSTWSAELRVLGNANAYWNYSASGIAEVTYDGNNTPSDFTPAGGGSRTTDGYSTVRINLANSATQARFRITLLNNATAESWVMDDIKITGTLNTAPTIFVSPSSLISFSQTSSTPSTEQTYTVSGNNLTGNVSIVPPTGFEISTTTGGSFSATNPIVLSQSGGDLVGEPVTIYVRQSASTLGAISGNIAHTSSGASTVNTAVSGTRTGTYYYAGSGNLDVLTNWGLNTDGTGANPSDFTSAGIIYEIRNAATATIGANWVVSGASSKVVIGDGTIATDFTIPSGYTLTGTVDISNAAELTIENSTAPTFGTFATNSTLEYNNVAVTLSSVITYRNLKLTGSGTKTFPGNTTTITGNLILNGITINGSSTNPFSTILLAGNLTYDGIVTPPSAANSITLSTNGTAAGTQTITGAGNTLRWFRITTTTANTILLSTSSGSSNFYAGNNSGGGITLVDGSVINMNGNDFQLFNNGATSAAFVMTTGTISTTASTDFNIERTGNGALGTLRFTTGANTIGNLTLNHTGTINTLTIGNALNINGVITVTDGTLASGGNITLISDASGTASIATIVTGGSITGNIIVERYIPANGRRYRFLASPVVGGTTLQWRNNATNLSGRGIQITGTGTVDTSTSNQPSAFYYNEASTANTGINGIGKWVAIDGSTTLTNGSGYRVFVRGDRSIDITTVNSTNNATTISVTGTHPTGTVSLPVTYTTGAGGLGWNLVGNPYPCSIDWNASGWVKTNINDQIAIYRPSTNSYSYYTTTGNVILNDGSNIIGSGQAFWIKATAAPTLTCTESIKVTSAPPTVLLKSAPSNQLRLKLTQDSSNIDETIIAFGEKFSNDFIETEDVNKLVNATVNISSVVGFEKYVAINFTSNNYTEKTIPLSVWGNINGNYKLELTQVEGFDAGVTVNLRDKFLNTIAAINENKTFNIVLNDNSKGDNRFELVFKNTATNVENVSNVTNLSVYPNPVTDILNISLSNATAIETVNIYNVSGKLVKNTKLNDNQIDISQLNNGVYMVEVLTTNGSSKTRFVK